MVVSLKHTTQAVGTDAGNGEIGKSQWNEEHTLTLATGKLLGRSTAGTGAAEEITVGSGLSLSGGTLTASGTVGGADTQVQFNDGSAFGGDAGLTYNKTTNALTIGAGSLNFTGGTSGTVTLQPAAAAGTYTLTLPTTAGSSNQVLTTNGSGVLSWTTPSSGGTPGGSDTQLQYNSSGSFAGASGLTTNGTELTIASGTKTTDAPLLNMSQTWNAGAVTFTGLKLNVTDTASAAASNLLDLQVGGNKKFYVDKTGRVNVLDLNCWDGDLIIYRAGTASMRVNNTQTSISGALAISSNSNPSAPDAYLSRRAAANLRLGATDAAAPVAQTLSVQSVVAGTPNTAGADLTITGSQGTGSGAGGSIIFQLAQAGSSGTAQNALGTALVLSEASAISRLTLGRAGRNAALSLGPSGSGIEASWDGTYAIFKLGSNNIIDFRGTSCHFPQNYFVLGGFTVGSETRVYTDAANTLALRNGTNGQTQNIYGTFTDTSNYRRVAVAMTTAGVATIKPEGAGTGASGNVLHISGLPTSNPGAGILWNDAGTVKVGT